MQKPDPRIKIPTITERQKIVGEFFICVIFMALGIIFLALVGSKVGEYLQLQ